LPNKGFINCISEDIVVEIPAIINKSGVKGQNLKNYPKSFATVLNSQVGTIQLTTEAVLKRSKQLAYLAMLADPVINDTKAASNILQTMIEFQKDYLGYLK